MFEPKVFVALAAFAIIATAARGFGRLFQRFHLPLITGFLFTGIIAGPYALGLISTETTTSLRFVDQIALAFIAFAAGGEMHLKELRSRLKSIGWVTLGLVVSTFTIASTFLVLVSNYIPFMAEMTLQSRIAVAILGGSILVARSPSSAIAVVNEMRARGPFTRTALGVTVVMDVVVILIFALNSSIADVLLTQDAFQPMLIVLVIGEILTSILLGGLIGKLALPLITRLPVPAVLRATLMILCGWGVFYGSDWLRHWTEERYSFEILLEPLLICMAASFVVANQTTQRAAFQQLIDDAGPLIYTVFFTLAGASLALDVLWSAWAIALAIFAVRIVAIAIGTFIGGTIAGDPARVNRVGWMAYITQAGIGLGLAKQVSAEFQPWGATFGTLIIAVIVLNQFVGPPLFKWVLTIVGEAHVGAGKRDLKGTPSAIIFGLDAQAVGLARQLDLHGWRVVIATGQENKTVAVPRTNADIRPIASYDREELERIGAKDATAIVSLLRDEDSLQVAEVAYEHFGTRNIVVQLHDRKNSDSFQDLGVRLIDPDTALISLLDHFVRSPGATALLLGMESGQDAEDYFVFNPDLDGVALRDLRLPLDTLVLAIQRRGATLVSHGYTTLELGDRVTVVGSAESLVDVERKLQSA